MHLHCIFLSKCYLNYLSSFWGALHSNKLITVNKLIDSYRNNKSLNNKIIGIKLSSRGDLLKLNFPIDLDNESYFKLYALMISEGSIRTEFSLNVPESEFHKIFDECIKRLISKEIIIKKDFNNNFERSRAPAVIRYLIPIKDHLPYNLFSNREFAREYLKIVFEAEGCPIFNLTKSKKYIKLSRNNDVSNLFNKETSLPEQKRVFIKKIKENYKKQYDQLIKNPPPLILGEYLLLKHCFDVDSSLRLENICLNKIGNRKGKITSQWVIYIYSGEDLKKFNNQIGFISNSKIHKCNEMIEKIPSHNKQYTALNMHEWANNNN